MSLNTEALPTLPKKTNLSESDHEDYPFDVPAANIKMPSLEPEPTSETPFKPVTKSQKKSCESVKDECSDFKPLVEAASDGPSNTINIFSTETCIGFPMSEVLAIPDALKPSMSADEKKATVTHTQKDDPAYLWTKIRTSLKDRRCFDASTCHAISQISKLKIATTIF